MSDPEAFLAALQLADSSFPSGLYTQSHGLESLIQAGRIRTLSDLEALLPDYLHNVAGPCDAVACAGAVGADTGTLAEIDRLLYVMKLPQEIRQAAQRSGRQLAAMSAELSDSRVLAAHLQEVATGASPGCYAVVLGALAGAWGLSKEQAAQVELYSFVSSLLGVALRTLRAGHTGVQGVLTRVRPLIEATAREAAATDYHEMWSFAPCIEVMQMRHSRAEVRLFAS